MTDPLELCQMAVESYRSDPQKAYSLFSEAAAAGHPNGFFGMAEMKVSGFGTERDVEGAVELYRVAAEAGHPPSMYRLGMLYSGTGEVEEDPAQCKHWFEMAAEAGMEQAYPEIGGIYLYGYGTPQDPEQVTFAPLLSRALSPIDWTRPAKAIHDQVRGLVPWPATSTDILGGGAVKVFAVRETGEDTGKAPGSILSAGKDGICVACGDGKVLAITELQAPGSRRMATADYLRGHPISV